MTPAQKEAAKRAELRLQQMRDAGMIVPALDAPDRAKKPVYDKKKKKGGVADKAKAEAEAAEEKRLQEEKERIEAEKQAKKAAEEAQNLREAEEAAAKAKKEDDDVLDSWEDAIGEDGNIKESWDDDSEDEELAGKRGPPDLPVVRCILMSGSEWCGK